MLSWILGNLYIDWFWKPLVYCVYVYVHLFTRMCSCVSVFLFVTWKWLNYFAEKTILIILNTHDFHTETTGKTLSNEAWKISNLQQTEILLP